MPLNLKYKITEKITTTLNCQLPKYCHSCFVISLDNESRVPKILSKFKENLNAKIEVGENSTLFLMQKALRILLTPTRMKDMVQQTQIIYR
jgi:hypothetical protein